MLKTKTYIDILIKNEAGVRRHKMYINLVSRSITAFADVEGVLLSTSPCPTQSSSDPLSRGMAIQSIYKKY